MDGPCDPTRSGTPTRPGTPRRRAPAALWAVLVLHAALLGLWAQAIPVYFSPDEQQHLDMALAVREEGGWPGPGERRIDRQLREASFHFPLRGFDLALPDTFPLPADLAPPRSARRSFDEVAPAEPTDATNQQWQHPPGYYAALGGGWAVLDAVPGAADRPFDREIALLRLLSALLALPLPAVAWAIARRVGAAPAGALVAALVPVGIPQLTAIGGSVSNDTPLWALAGVVVLLAVDAARGRPRVRTAAVAGAAAGAALLVKGFALVLPPVLAAGAALGWWRARQGGTPQGRGGAALGWGAIALAVALATGGWWWVRNLVVHGAVQPSGAAFPPPPEDFTPSIGAFLGELVPRLVERTWGVFGLLQAPLPSGLAWAATAVVVLAAALGVRALREVPGEAALLALPLVLVTGLVAYGAWGYHVESGALPGIQGRYLYLGVPGAAALVGAAVPRGRVGAAAALGALAAVVGLQVTGLATALGHFWGPPGPGAEGVVAAALAWGPFHPAVPLVLAGTAVTAAAALAAVLVRGPRRLRDAGRAKTGAEGSARSAADTP